MESRLRSVFKYVVPTIMGSVCFFMFTIIDGIFVGHGVGADGLGAVNLTMPFVMVVNALFMLFTAGGVTIVAVRFGEGDKNGANEAYASSMLIAIVISALMCALGVFFTKPLCILLGADENYYQMTYEYLFWYSVFIIPSGLSTALQGFVRNDGEPVLVSAAIIAGTVLNIFGDWLCIFPLKMGLAGAAVATGVSQTATLVILLFHFAVAVFFGTAEGLQPLFGHCYGSKNIKSLHYYFKAGIIINIVGAVVNRRTFDVHWRKRMPAFWNQRRNIAVHSSGDALLFSRLHCSFSDNDGKFIFVLNDKNHSGCNFERCVELYRECSDNHDFPGCFWKRRNLVDIPDL